MPDRELASVGLGRWALIGLVFGAGYWVAVTGLPLLTGFVAGLLGIEL